MKANHNVCYKVLINIKITVLNLIYSFYEHICMCSFEAYYKVQYKLVHCIRHFLSLSSFRHCQKFMSFPDNKCPFQNKSLTCRYWNTICTMEMWFVIHIKGPYGNRSIGKLYMQVKYLTSYKSSNCVNRKKFLSIRVNLRWCLWIAS